MRVVEPADWPDAAIAASAVIEAEEIHVGFGASVEEGVRIRARRIVIGRGARIERETQARALTGEMESFVIGDQSLIGFANQIYVPAFSMGDYTQIHNSGLHSGYKPLNIGHNCWIGQASILNSTECLSIGNNVRIGTGSQIWTHVASGELLEGCTLYGEHPVTLEDDVWLVGGAVVSPGLTVARKSIVMTGAVLTKSTEPYHTYAGIPARDVTDRLNFWKSMSSASKVAMMDGFIAEFLRDHHRYEGRLYWMTPAIARPQAGDVILTKNAPDWELAGRNGASLFDLDSKTYFKQSSELEIAWIKWLVGFRARFIPRNP